jgi:hypothetical protein
LLLCGFSFFPSFISTFHPLSLGRRERRRKRRRGEERGGEGREGGEGRGREGKGGEGRGGERRSLNLISFCFFFEHSY